MHGPVNVKFVIIKCGFFKKIVLFKISSARVISMCYKKQSRTPCRWHRQSLTRVTVMVKKWLAYTQCALTVGEQKGDTQYDARCLQVRKVVIVVHNLSLLHILVSLH